MQFFTLSQQKFVSNPFNPFNSLYVINFTISILIFACSSLRSPTQVCISCRCPKTRTKYFAKQKSEKFKIFDFHAVQQRNKFQPYETVHGLQEDFTWVSKYAFHNLCFKTLWCPVPYLHKYLLISAEKIHMNFEILLLFSDYDTLTNYRFNFTIFKDNLKFLTVCIFLTVGFMTYLKNNLRVQACNLN